MEQRMYDALLDQLGQERGSALKIGYITARTKLLTKVLPHVIVADPNMTDHSATHVADVMQNAERLIGPQALAKPDPPLSAADAYTLCLAILFHDAGMVYGRTGHQNRITEIYKWVQGDTQRPIQEQPLLHSIAGSHTGLTDSGSHDTIADVPPTMHFEGEPVQSQEVAAILRFADELAEGPHRTSTFMEEKLGLPCANKVYHHYSAITSARIDRPEGRIVLSYEIELNEKMTQRSKRFRRLLDFTFRRVVKVDRERRYARSYSTLLAPFNRTEVTLNFWQSGNLVYHLNRLELSDKTVLDRRAINLSDIDARYDVGSVATELDNALGPGG
jgi:hypothetical protein